MVLKNSFLVSSIRTVFVIFTLSVFTFSAKALEIEDLDKPTSSVALSSEIIVKNNFIDSADFKVADAGLLLASAKNVVDEVNDPIETINRGIFAFNEFFLQNLLSPLTDLYQSIFPDPLQEGIGNFLQNLQSPIILLNDLLQGEWIRASVTSRRFLMNSTIGIGGLVDIAENSGLPAHDEDLGQTFAVWGVSEGPYLVIPLLGPSNPRDILGKFISGYLDPVSHYTDNADLEELNYVRTGFTAVDEYGSVRDELKEIKKTSIDYYASIRSLYRQKRQGDIYNGKGQKLPPIPDFLSYDYNTTSPFQPAQVR